MPGRNSIRTIVAAAVRNSTPASLPASMRSSSTSRLPFFGVANGRLPARSLVGPIGSRRPALKRSVPESELGFLAHQVRRPRRGERHLRIDGADSVELAHELLDLLGDLRPDRAAGR